MHQFFLIFVNVFVEIYSFLIIARILMSWLSGRNYGRFSRFLYETTEPYLAVFRKIIPQIAMVDFSPVVALFCLDLAKDIVINMIQYLSF